MCVLLQVIFNVSKTKSHYKVYNKGRIDVLHIKSNQNRDGKARRSVVNHDKISYRVSFLVSYLSSFRILYTISILHCMCIYICIYTWLVKGCTFASGSFINTCHTYTLSSHPTKLVRRR